MVDIAVNLIVRKWKNNFVIALIIGITMLLGVISVSTYDKLTEKTRYYNSILNMNGGIYHFEYLYSNYKEWVTQSEVKPDDLHGVLEYVFAIENEPFHIYAYDEIESKYRLPLKKGVWYTEADDKGYICAVITPNSNYDVGDIIRPADYMEYADPDLVIKICGITEDKFDYLNFNTFDPDNMTLQTFYTNFYDDGLNMPTLIFMSSEKVEESPYFNYQTNMLLGFNDKNDEQEVDRMAYSFAKYMKMEELKANTKHEVELKIYEIFPIFVAVFVITIICIACIISIELTYDIKTYAILFLCGMKWKSIMTISIIRAFVNSVVGLGIMSALGIVVKEFIMKRQLVLGFGMYQGLLCIGVFFFVYLTFCVITYVVIKNKEPVEIIRNSNE